MFETFDHTADLGLRIRAADLEALFAEAAQALVSVLVENPADVRTLQKREIALRASGLDYLLFDWLNELLFAYDEEHWLGGRFSVKVQELGAEWALAASAEGEAVDPARHRLDHEVKAITYHGLKVLRQADGSWLAEVIVDI
jgi:SHS2 domain-containing protein